MGILIDASVLIEHERGRINLEERVSDRAGEPILLSVVTASELLHGVHRADTVARQTRRSAWVEALLDRFPLLPIGLATARAHARLGAELARQGRQIGPNDTWIAAACLAHGHSLATANEREFSRVEELAVENWST